MVVGAESDGTTIGVGSGAGVTVRPATTVAPSASTEISTAAPTRATTVREDEERDIDWFLLSARRIGIDPGLVAWNSARDEATTSASR
jgi:hypothetical protein